MLLSAIVTLAPLEAREAPASQARALHAWLLARIGAHDAALAQRLHDEAGPRPFTVSDLWGAGAPRDGRVRLDPARPLTCRFTALSAETVHALQRALPAVGERLTLAEEAPFAVQAVAGEAAAHAWAGRATYVDLLQQHTLRSAPPPRSVTLRFASPTLFRQEGRDLPLPLPALVFGSYLARWNAFAPQALPAEVKRYADECIALGRYALRSQLVSFEQGDKGAHVGFTGLVRFRFLVGDPFWMRLMALLAAYAFWCGTGYRTTAGLGQTRLGE